VDRAEGRHPVAVPCEPGERVKQSRQIATRDSGSGAQTQPQTPEQGDESSHGEACSAIRTMGRYQVGVLLTDQDIRAIATWMRSLSGAADPQYIAMPNLPPRTERTPKPVLD